VLRAVVLTQYRRVTDGQTDEQTDSFDVVKQCQYHIGFSLPIVIQG